jgi:hypothetical protein
MPVVAEDSSFYALCSSKSIVSSHLIDIFSLVMYLSKKKYSPWLCFKLWMIVVTW